MRFTVRKATEGDFPQVCAVLAEADALHREALLNVWEFNQGAAAFYEKLGYTAASRRMCYPLQSKEGKMAEWYKTFFDGLYAQVLPDALSGTKSGQQARIVKRLLRARTGQRVLDVPCGKGRLTIPMARMGLEMTGVDLTSAYLRRARRLARQEGLAIRFVHSDMRDIAFDGEFDAAFNWFGSFGYFPDGDNLRFCQRVLAALEPGDRFLIEGINKSWLLSHFRRTDTHTAGDMHIAMRNRWNAATNRVHSTWTFTDGKTTERHRITMRIFNGAELRALLRNAGFRDVQLWQRDPVGRFTRHSRRLIAVGTRPCNGRKRR